MIFTVEVTNPDKLRDAESEVEIYIDKNELALLNSELEKLQTGKAGDHLHYMSESWGAGDLSEEIQGNSTNSLIHHLRITLTEE